jgi:hypothetical protein
VTEELAGEVEHADVAVGYEHEYPCALVTAADERAREAHRKMAPCRSEGR